MIDSRLAAAASLSFLLGGQSLVAQAPFQHREYSLVSSAATVGADSRSRTVNTVHEVLFTFYNDQCTGWSLPPIGAEWPI